MDASLDDILGSIDTESKKKFNKKELMKQFLEIHGDNLKNYELLSPDKLKYNVRIGDVIRYSKDAQDKLSCASVIVKINYVGNGTDINLKYIKNIILKSPVHDSVWQIIPSKYYIFKYNGIRSSQNTKMIMQMFKNRHKSSHNTRDTEINKKKSLDDAMKHIDELFKNRPLNKKTKK